MHLFILSHGTPSQHKNFTEKVKLLRYPIEGPIRKGYNIPHISEVKIWDVRIKEECAPAFLEDLGVLTETDLEHENIQHHLKGNKIIKWADKIRGMLGLKSIKYDLKKGTPFLDGWYQNFLIGIKEDPKTKWGEEL